MEESSHRPMSGFYLLHIPYDERWEHLKPTMVDAYMGMNGFGEPLTFPKLADFMKKNHGFSAEIHQYRHRFKKWGIRKRTIKEEKEGIVKTLGKRNRAGASTSDVTIYQGGLTKEVDKKQLKRFLNDEIRHQVAMPLFPGAFSQWNLPYAAYKASIAKPMDHPSPFGLSPAAPQYLHINSPEATTPDMEYVIEPSSPNETQAEFDFHDVSSWTPWPASETQAQTLQAVMEESFKHSRFSTTSVDDLPISNKLVTEAVSNSPEQLALDSCAFAIMSGNLESVTKLLRGGSPIDIGAIYPYHLAASFLDGGHTCCLVMHGLIYLLHFTYPIALNNVNADGHTVLDSLMVSILRSHTSLTPVEVSPSFIDSTRFPGEEKDICGRWDADSPELRQLYKEGHPKIPRQWKHNFCHSMASFDIVALTADLR
ncbi:hypothetical protein LZ32DRAFT_526181 [Colletotrichum eremochloae]|nr:hypothetical protein LZ32DRAFT_526181 [Colletotrichum eremochloae]